MCVYFGAIFAAPLLCATFPCFLKEHHFLPKKLSPEIRSCLEWVLSFQSPLQTGSAHTTFGSGAVISALLEDKPIRKKARFAFHCQVSYSIVFFHWVNYTLHVRSFKTLGLCHLWDCYGGHLPRITKFCFSPFVWRWPFHMKSCFPRRGRHLEWVSSYWSPVKTTSVYRVFDRGAVPLA